MKMWNYVVIAVFLALLFEMSGLSVASSLLSRIGISLEQGVSAFKSGIFYLTLVGLLGASAVSGITIGYLTKSPSENYVILPFIIAEILFFSVSMIGIVSVASGIGGWIYYLTLLIVAPLLVGFGVSAYEHFRGTD